MNKDFNKVSMYIQSEAMPYWAPTNTTIPAEALHLSRVTDLILQRRLYWHWNLCCFASNRFFIFDLSVGF